MCVCVRTLGFMIVLGFGLVSVPTRTFHALPLQAQLAWIANWMMFILNSLTAEPMHEHLNSPYAEHFVQCILSLSESSLNCQPTPATAFHQIPNASGRILSAGWASRV